MEISRREFVRMVTATGIGAAAARVLLPLFGCSNQVTSPTTGPSTSPPLEALPPSSVPSASAAATSIPAPLPRSGDTYLAVARGKSPSAMVQAAVKALGGIERFVKPGNDVIIKPNICVAYHTYEYAATTNPEVVGALVALCLGAGARRVRVFDQPFGGTAPAAYARSGIEEVVRTAGGQMEIMSNMKFREVAIPGGRDITKWSVYGDALDADVFINVPIAKHHNLARLTLGMKNLMGVVKDRPQLHSNLGQRVADIASVVRPTLNIVDAVRILVNHGPTGGSLSDVKQMDTVIASTDIVAADAYAATLFGLTGADIPYLRAASQMGLGIMDLKAVKIDEFEV